MPLIPDSRDPSARHDPRDEYTLLCETCGYVLEGLDHAVNCPECGTPIAESLPELVRPGSLWQQSPSFKSLLQTYVLMLSHPCNTLDRVRIDARSSGSLEGWTVLLSASVVVMPFIVFFVARILKEPNPAGRTLVQDAVMGIVMVGVMFMTACLVLLILTGIERVGIRSFGRIHKRRITSAVATTVCAHASVGWLTGSMLFASIMLLGLTLGTRPMVGVALFCLLLGLLHFEILVWLGVKRCRYANRERPQTSPPLSRPVTPSP